MKKKTMIYTTGMVIILFAAWSVSQLSSSSSVTEAKHISGTPKKAATKKPALATAHKNVPATPKIAATVKPKKHTVQQPKIAVPVIVALNEPKMEITVKEVAKPVQEETRIFSTGFLKSQEFLLGADRDTVITGKEGMKVAIAKNCFVDMDGNAVNGKIKIELKEALTHKDIALANLVTKSNKQLLESGGMFYLNATANGKQLKVAKGKSISARVPAKRKLKGMKLYQGVQTEGGLNWVDPVALVQPIPRPEQKKNKVVFLADFRGETDDVCECAGVNTFREDKSTAYTIRTSNLGWANIDRLVDDKRTKQIDFITTIENNKDYDNVYITMIFKYRNIYLPGYRTKNGTYSFTHGDYEKTALPVGEKAIVIATAYKGEQPYFSIKEVVIANKTDIALQLQQTEKAEMEKQIKKML